MRVTVAQATSHGSTQSLGGFRAARSAHTQPLGTTSTLRAGISKFPTCRANQTSFPNPLLMPKAAQPQCDPLPVWESRGDGVRTAEEAERDPPSFPPPPTHLLKASPPTAVPLWLRGSRFSFLTVPSLLTCILLILTMPPGKSIPICPHPPPTPCLQTTALHHFKSPSHLNPGQGFGSIKRQHAWLQIHCWLIPCSLPLAPRSMC